MCIQCIDNSSELEKCQNTQREGERAGRTICIQMIDRCMLSQVFTEISCMIGAIRPSFVFLNSRPIRRVLAQAVPEGVAVPDRQAAGALGRGSVG